MLIKRDIENALVYLNVHNAILPFIEFNNCDTRHLNEPRCLFHLFAAIPDMYLGPGVYMSPALLRIKTVCVCMYVCTYVCTYVHKCICGKVYKI